MNFAPECLRDCAGRAEAAAEAAAREEALQQQLLDAQAAALAAEAEREALQQSVDGAAATHAAMAQLRETDAQLQRWGVKCQTHGFTSWLRLVLRTPACLFALSECLNKQNRVGSHSAGHACACRVHSSRSHRVHAPWQVP